MKTISALIEDLSPPLGFAGPQKGACAVIQRIRKEAPKPIQQALVDPVEDGIDLSNKEASQIYDLETEPLPTGANTYFKKLIISSHAQYRMDLRGITIEHIKTAIQNFTKDWLKHKGMKSPVYDTWNELAQRREPINWTDMKQKLFLAFTIYDKDREITLVTSYWRDQLKVKAPGDGGCDSE